MLTNSYRIETNGLQFRVVRLGLEYPNGKIKDYVLFTSTGRYNVYWVCVSSSGFIVSNPDTFQCDFDCAKDAFNWIKHHDKEAEIDIPKYHSL